MNELEHMPELQDRKPPSPLSLDGREEPSCIMEMPWGAQTLWLRICPWNWIYLGPFEQASYVFI